MKWVYCNSHGAVHSYEEEEDLWCKAVLYDGVWAHDSVQMNYTGEDIGEARTEADAKGLWLYWPIGVSDGPRDP